MCKKRQEEYGWHYRNVIKTVKKNSPHICYYCGKQLSDDDLTVDHLTPLSRGGKTVSSNLRICCKYCNNRKGNMTEKEYKESLIFHADDYININEIQIPKLFLQRPVRKTKIQKVVNYYNLFHCFDEPVTLKSKDQKLLTDGYARYTVAKMLNIDRVPVVYS